MERSREEVERLIVRYKGLVRKTARKNFPDRVKDQDLLQCGLIGLWEAAETWDAKKSTFTTYATYCVKHNILDYLRSESKVPIPIQNMQEEVIDDEMVTLSRLDLLEKIKAAWLENSRERYILIALSSGVSMQAAAIALGVPLQTAKELAEKAWERIEQEGG